MEEQTKETRTVTLKFLREQLLYDIRNYAYIEGEAKSDEMSVRAKTTLVEIGEEGNVDRVTRILAVVFTAVIEMLYPYTKMPAEAEEIDDKLWAPDEYVVELTVPVTFSRTSSHLLSRLIHEFMVYSVIADWLSIMNPTASSPWLLKAQALREQIVSIRNNRTGTLTRKSNPF